MKKQLIILLIFVLMAGSVFAADNVSGPAEDAAEAGAAEFSIADKVRSFMLVNHPEEMERLVSYDEEWKREASEQMVRQDEEAKHIKYTDEEWEREVNNWMGLRRMIPEKSFRFYPVITTRYASQYAENHSFETLINKNRALWYAFTKSPYPDFYTVGDFERVPINVYKGGTSTFLIADDQTIEFLNDPEAIEEMVKEEIDEEIVDCEIVVIPYGATVLYLKGVNLDYGIKIYHDKGLNHEASLLDSFKIYTMTEILQSCSEYQALPSQEILDVKPTYDLEMQSLMDAGLLQGNDNGADPLKPMSRIEAMTVLVRALGLEDEPVSEESQFADIEDGSWGVKYANIAYANGISNGVGDNLFAPDDRISAEQFSTLVLRNSEGQDFDWTQGLNILIEKGVITAEQADTMDLFTRADMAKIIYEARAKGLL